MKDKKNCSVLGCEKTHYGKGYCAKHYSEFRKHGEIRTQEEKTEDIARKRREKAEQQICSVCSAKPAKLVKKLKLCYCEKHYQQLLKYGKILERTVFDPNEIRLYEGYAGILLYNRRKEVIGETFVDIEDLEICKKFKWGILTRGQGKDPYVYCSIKRKSYSLSRMLLGLYEKNSQNKNLEVDHINHNTLDNRKENLRLCTRQQNNFNHKPKPSKSGEKCIYLNKDGKYIPYGKLNNKKIHLGCFSNLEDAKKVRLEFEKKTQKEFRYGGLQ